MGKAVLFPGQVERLEFNLDQVRALASPMRSEVFWTYSSSEPLSAQEVASRADRSKGSVYYHTAELVRVGLLLPVAERQRRSRKESLFVRAGLSLVGQPPPLSDEYRLEAARGFSAILRSLARERRVLHRVWSHYPDIASIALFRLHSLRLKPADAADLRTRLVELVEEFSARESAEGMRLRLAIIAHPDMGELRRAYRQATGEDIPADPAED